MEKAPGREESRAARSASSASVARNTCLMSSLDVMLRI